MSVSELRDRLRDDAPELGRGRIKIDAQRALQKLRDHRLADPHHYVLELLRAAVASGATAVSIRNDADDFELTFDGRPFPAEVLRDLFAYALTSGGDDEATRFRLLALGVNGALALRPRWIEIESGGHRLRVRKSAKTDLEPSEAPTTSTRIHVREGIGLRTLRDAVVGPAEAQVIFERSAQFPGSLTINGQPVQRPLFDGWKLALRHEVESGTLGLVVAVPEEPIGTSSLHVDVLGVRVVTRGLELPALQVLAWCRDDTLRRSASGADIVDNDPATVALDQELRAQADLLLEEMFNWFAEPERERERVGTARRIFTAVAAKALPRFAIDPAAPTRRARAVLEAAPILPGPAGEWCSVADLKAEVEKGRPVRISKRTYAAGGLYDPPVVLLKDRESPLAKILPAGRLHDIHQDVLARVRAERNRRAFEAQPAEEPRLPPGSYRARITIDEEGFRGELGLPPEGETAVVRYLRCGKLLELREVMPLSWLRVRAVIDSGSFSPDASWQGVAEDSVLVRAHVVLVSAARRCIIDALASGPSDAIRAYGRDLVAWRARSEAPDVTIEDELARAPIFESAGGGWTSLAELGRWPAVRTVDRPWPHAALDGNAIVVLRPRDREAVERILPGKAFIDQAERLRREADIRTRLAGPRTEPRLIGPMLAKVEVRREGIRGEVGVPMAGEGSLIRPLREGIALGEHAGVARYGPTVAVIECPALRPDDAWTAPVVDEAYACMTSAIHDAQRQLVRPLLESYSTLGTMPETARQYVLAFIRTDLSRLAARETKLDDVQRAVLDAPLFSGPSASGVRSLSLAQVAAAARQAGKIWLILEDAEAPRMPESMTVVYSEPGIERVLSEVLELSCEDSTAEILRIVAREAFEAQPEREPRLPDGAAIRVPVDARGVEGEVGFVPGAEKGVQMELLYSRRPLCARSVQHPLPLRAVLDVRDKDIDPAVREIPPQLEWRVDLAVQRAGCDLLDLALADPSRPGAREILLAAVGSCMGSDLPPPLRDRLLEHPQFPTLEGTSLPASALAGRTRITYVTTHLSGAAPSGEPVVVASDPAVRAALDRWTGSIVDVTDELAADIAIRRTRDALPALERIEVWGPTLRRLSMSQGDIDGEVALLAGESAGRVTFHHRRRVLCEEAADLPAGVAAAVDCDRLTPTSRHDGVTHDAVHAEVLAAVFEGVDTIAAVLAAEWGAMPASSRSASVAVAVRLAAWLVCRSPDYGHVLQSVPLLEATDGRPLSVRDLAEAQKGHGKVLCADVKGGLLEAERWVWRPRFSERAIFADRFVLEDATELLERMAELQSRPRVTSLAVPIVTRWREPVSSNAKGVPIEGEVALPPVASGERRVELLREGRLVETVVSKHPIGYHARVSCDALAPDESWSKVVRNGAFQAVTSAVGMAFHRLFVRLLADETRPGGWRSYAIAAARWKSVQTGPIAEIRPRLAVLRDVTGADVTLGRAWSESSERSRVGVADLEVKVKSPPDRLILAVGPEDRQLLADLGIEVEDLTVSLLREAEREAQRKSRRLSDLRYPGDAVARIEVDADGWRGELALPLFHTDPPQPTGIRLARAGVFIDEYVPNPQSIVGGVLDHPELPVDHDWNRAALGDEDRARIGELIDALFARLAEATLAGLAPELRESAAIHALTYLHLSRGVTAPAHLDRLDGAPEALAHAKILPLADGRWVDLRSVAERVVRRGYVAAIGKRLSPREIDGDVVLLIASESLETAVGWVLGEGAVRRFDDLASFREHRAEDDPDPETPLGVGLALLRREAELLHADACGNLLAQELSGVRLRARGGKRATHYDPERGIITIDPDHPGARRALEGARERPDLLYVLLAAIYGAINRASERVTDDDEERLAETLTSHLEANPSLLEPR
ncbi:MAG: hypothetical protein HYY06_04230 [Deltaproteobacteria bacterium]|nr:hypothetical protein [Deltaproteobacteria bacterium]